MPIELIETSSTIPIVPPTEIPAERSAPARRAQKHNDVPVLGRDAQANKTNWLTTGFMVAFHLLAVVALFMFTWKAFFCFLGLYVLAINMGIGMGYHRLLTHRGYKTQVAGVFPFHLRHARARRWTHLLGGHASRSSPTFGSPGRPAHTP